MMLQLFNLFADSTQKACNLSGGGFLKFPKWYEYLGGTHLVDSKTGSAVTSCSPAINGLSDIWLIVAAAIEILLQVAALAAIAFVIYGGVQYMTSQGEPASLEKARSTIINALIGLAIAILSSVIINFIAGSIH